MNRNLSIHLITYKRTQIALKTIEALKTHLVHPRNLIHFHISDDGSPQEHIDALVNQLLDYNVTITNANRQGVGHSMNIGMTECLKHSDHILWMEDDWLLMNTFIVDEYLQVFEEHPDIGMLRLGYLSPGLIGELIPASNRLWWKLSKGPQYSFVGHAALRTKAFCNAYGLYPTKLSPGQTELAMCGKFNNTPGPTVAFPADTGIYGIFHHIGSESYKDLTP